MMRSLGRVVPRPITVTKYLFRYWRTTWVSGMWVSRVSMVIKSITRP